MALTKKDMNVCQHTGHLAVTNIDDREIAICPDCKEIHDITEQIGVKASLELRTKWIALNPQEAKTFKIKP